MPYKKTGTNIQTLIEPATGGRTAQSLPGYKINGTMLSAATVTSGYLYSNEKYTPTGYKKAGAQLVFQNIGCRPRSGTVIWESNGKTGTILFSREFFGKSYVIVQLWGAGGGSTNGYTLNNDRAGGGSGASAVVCLRLPVSGAMSIGIGSGGGVSSSIGAGSAGTASTITCGKKATALAEECEALSALAAKYISENAQAALDQTAYQKRFDSLMKRHETAKNQLSAVEEERQSRLTKRQAIARFVTELEQADGPMADFDEALWFATVESVTIYAGEAAFQWRDGNQTTIPLK